jgi:hypothetical protein
MDDFLAMALNAFHPRADGTNPHKLDTIKLVISGNVLFHRFNYALVSPAVSYEVSSKLHKLMTNGLSIEGITELSFKVNSTEKATTKALLGIRGVKNVIIEHRGRAKMEPAFADTIKRTLVLPPGTQSASSEVESSTPSLDQGGVFLSQKMRAQELCGKKEYPTRNHKVMPDSECGKTRVLIDEAIQLHGHLTNASEETTKRKPMEAASRVPKGKISSKDCETINSTTAAVALANSNSPRALRTTKRRKMESNVRLVDGLRAKDAGNASPDLVAARQTRGVGPQGNVVEDMVRIVSKPQNGDDLILPKNMEAPCFIDQRPRVKGMKNREWLVLTGKGGMAQMGWKTH